ncbi:MAG: DUF3857 and transglutaminase domain-containing protein, partial [Candidatus Poribacteria bacterium]|nr:DUF3857 and transglutaminase domain-containing protein [Candidatus Poribacteria bacterium]
MIRMLFVCTLLIEILFVIPAGFTEDYALIIGGVGGEKSFYDEFWSATSRMHNLLTEEYGYSPEHITFLFEDDGEIPGLVDGKSTKADVESAFAEMVQNVRSTDRFVLFMIGHANRASRGFKFNLPGRDLNDTEYAERINQIAAEQTILIFGFPYSARMVRQVSRTGRTIITSCSPREGYMRSGFGNIFIDAFSDGAADTDEDEAISLLEAFLYTQNRVKTWYENDGSVQSEHPHLDDNGDGIPTRKELPTDKEGLLAQQTFLGERRSPLMVATAPSTSEDSPQSSEKPASEDTDGTAESLTEPTISSPNRSTSIPYDFISAADDRQIETLISDVADPDDYPDTGAVVLWETEVLDINENNRYVYSTRRVVKIFNEKGHKFGEVSIPYTRGNDDVTIHHARTITPDGRTVALDQREIIKNIPPPSAVEAGLFVDARLMHFTMPEMSDGCIIDYAYSSNNRGHLMRGEFWRQVYFQTSSPVKYYRLTVQAPKKKTLHYQINGPQIEPKITVTNYTQTYTFETSDVPALREEVFMPAIEDLAYSISISSLDSWERLVEWYTTLIREQDYVTPEIEKKTKALLMGAWSRKEKIKRLYEYVATQIDYVGIELGIWAIKPHSAPQIIKDGYGDCKDKSTLLSAMLSVAGIKSYPVLIAAGKSRRVVRDIPSLAYFNHMILAAEENKDGDLMWLDATAETCAFGDLPASDQDRWTLIINPDFLTERKADTVEPAAAVTQSTVPKMRDRLYQFVKSPTIPADENLKRVVTHIQVENDLSVKATQEITVTGEFNTKLRSKLKYINPDERTEFLHEYMELDERARLGEVEIPDLNAMADELQLTLTWQCADYLFAIGRQFILELPIVEHPY